MTTRESSAPGIAQLRDSLRKRLKETDTAKAGRNPRKGYNNKPALDSQLQDELASLLELLGDCDNTLPLEAQSPPATIDSHALATVEQKLALDEFKALTLEAIDGALAHWQAQVSFAYAQGASQELADHIRLATSVCESLQSGESRIETQRAALEKQAALIAALEVRTIRQRTAIAQTLRAQKAEMLLAVEKSRFELTAHIRDEVTRELEDQPAADSPELQLLRAQLEETRQELELVSEELGAKSNECADILQQLQSLHERFEDSEQRAAELRAASEKNLRLAQELEETQALLRTAQTNATETAPDQAERVAELECQLVQAQDALEQLMAEQSTLQAAARTSEDDQAQQKSAAQQKDSVQQKLVAELETELQGARQVLQDLLEQNSDLAAQVAKHQVISTGHTPHVSFDQQSLTWEERKKLIMQQLESELENSESSTEEQQVAQLEIKQVLATTQMEIDRRDLEIQELQRIVEQQSDTRQGVAIGAAAIAQMFDSDELLGQEREKLREIQREWQEKLRQTEIDLSMERAKLARERLQLESELETCKHEKTTFEADAGMPKKRKWLEHLGLREEKGI